MYSYNTFSRPNLIGFSPYDMVFGRKSKILLALEISQDVQVTRAMQELLKSTLNC